MTGIDVSGRVIVLHDLQADLEAGGVPVPHGLTVQSPPVEGMPPIPVPPEFPAGSMLFTYDDQGAPTDLPPEAGPIVAAYSPSETRPV